ncbi:coiled-coil domain-containing protein 51-like [Acanthaster planci]|uniref:Coiled-coil domain-containing protein 51-like n=1 Tax=Acanthaster planci TaxID=133434 RepID=A0A8B7XMB9_ACAPL|nr:coiled-coil domain-containing protein 51-like [Acanthaster planci]
MVRQFDYQKLTVIRALRTISTSSSRSAAPAGSSVSGPGRPAGVGQPDQKGASTGLLSRLRSDGRVLSLLQTYEDVVGIGDVKRAQERVTQIEKEFMEVRETVKKSAQELHSVQADLRAIRAKLDRTPRDDAKFLEYATEEHLAIQKERKMEENHDLLEDVERSTFAKLSTAVRESHEKQRSQEERTKYWGIIGSIVGTIIGLLGSTAINQKRMWELRTMVGDLQKDIGQNGQLRDLQGLVADIRTAVGDGSSGDDSGPGTSEVVAALDRLAEQQREGLEAQEKNLTKILKHQEGVLVKEMEGVRRFAAVGTGDVTTLEELVNNAEQKLEWEMKMSTLSTVVFIYGAFALTLPILYSIFK